MNFNRSPFPVNSDTVSIYACLLSKIFKCTASVHNYVSGIKTMSTLPKYNVDDFYSPVVKLYVAGLDKLNTVLPNIRLPILVSHLLQMHECI